MRPAQYLSAASAAGLTEPDRTTIVNALSADPEMGNLMKETGGARKVCIAGKGKSGGYRVITFYAIGITPVVLLTLFGKGEKNNLTRLERNGLAVLTKQLLEACRPGRGPRVVG